MFILLLQAYTLFVLIKKSPRTQSARTVCSLFFFLFFVKKWNLKRKEKRDEDYRYRTWPYCSHRCWEHAASYPGEHAASHPGVLHVIAD